MDFDHRTNSNDCHVPAKRQIKANHLAGQCQMSLLVDHLEALMNNRPILWRQVLCWQRRWSRQIGECGVNLGPGPVPNRYAPSKEKGKGGHRWSEVLCGQSYWTIKSRQADSRSCSRWSCHETDPAKQHGTVGDGVEYRTLPRVSDHCNSLQWIGSMHHCLGL